MGRLAVGAGKVNCPAGAREAGLGRLCAGPYAPRLQIGIYPPGRYPSSHEVAIPFSSKRIKNRTSCEVPKKPFCDSFIVYPHLQFLYKPSLSADIPIQSKAPYCSTTSADVFPTKSSALYLEEQPERKDIKKTESKITAMYLFTSNDLHSSNSYFPFGLSYHSFLSVSTLGKTPEFGTAPVKGKGNFLGGEGGGSFWAGGSFRLQQKGEKGTSLLT